MAFQRTLIGAAVLCTAFPVLAANHVLDGRTLTVDELWTIAQPGETVSLSDEGWKRIDASYIVPIKAAEAGEDIYGLTVNYGALKDKKVTGSSVEAEPNRSASIAFNERQMRIQAAGFEPYLPAHVSKMSMVIRLNQMAAGYTAMSRDAARAYMEYINHDVTPLIPSRSSEGNNDLSQVTHIGLALMGEWDVMYKGKRRPASEVRKALKLKPYRPFGLDGISILSNGNVAEAQTIDALKNAEQVLRLSPVMIASSLEALNGNVSPFLWHTVETKGWPAGHEAAESVLLSLKGSFLWQKDPKRYLQDPLSFRSAGYVLAAAVNEYQRTKALLNASLNHTTDNPIVNAEGRADLWYSQLPAVKMLEFGGKGHYVNSCANFDNTQLALQVETLTRALGQVMHASAWRTTQLDDGHRTQLPTYLVAPENKGGDGFANIAQAMSGTYAEGMALTNSVMGYGVPTSIGIEENFNNLPVTAQRLGQMADRTREVYAYELMHTAQAMDLRVRMEGRTLGEGTKSMLKSYRKTVPFVDKDRAYTVDLNNSLKFLKSYQPKDVQF